MGLHLCWRLLLLLRWAVWYFSWTDKCQKNSLIPNVTLFNFRLAEVWYNRPLVLIFFVPRWVCALFICNTEICGVLTWKQNEKNSHNGSPRKFIAIAKKDERWTDNVNEAFEYIIYWTEYPTTLVINSLHNIFAYSNFY